MSDQSRTNTTVQKGRIYPPGYGVIEPVSNYRPWEVDAEFQAVYDLVRDATMVDIYRLWTLWYLARQVPPGDVLEIGSWRGGSGTVIARAVASRRPDGKPSVPDDSNASAAPPPPRPDVTARAIFLADTFAGVVKAGARDTYYKGGEHANTSVDLVQELLTKARVTDVTLLAGIFPDDTGDRIADRRLALCHIDVDVYQSAKDCFEWAWPRMVPGGVVVFDDYGFYGCEGVTSYVNDLAAGAEPPPGAASEPGSANSASGRIAVVPSLSGQAIVTRA